MTPRILVFSTAYLPYIGGAEIAIQEIARRTQGVYSFDLVCARFSRSLPAKEVLGAVTVYRKGVGIRFIDKLLLPWFAALHAVSHKYDLYWAMMVTYGSGGAYLARWLTKVPIVLTLQEGDPPAYLRRKWFGLLALSWRLALSQSKAVTAISAYLARLANIFGYKGSAAIVPNGVDTKRFASIERLPHEGTVLVTTSRLVHKNAIDDVLYALALLPEDVSFAIYGTGPDEEKLRILAKKLKVEHRAHFNGQVPYEELPAKLAAADIFIRPSRSEGMGNSFIEAMAAGLPVIATQEGGIADFLFDAKRNPDKEATGFAVNKDAPEEIAAAVNTILNDTAATARTVVAAKALVLEHYDWNLVANKMKAVFDRTLERR